MFESQPRKELREVFMKLAPSADTNKQQQSCLMLLANRVGDMACRPIFIGAASFYKIYAELVEGIKGFQNSGNSMVERVHHKQFPAFEQLLMNNLCRWDKMKQFFPDPRMCQAVTSAPTGDGNNIEGAEDASGKADGPSADSAGQVTESEAAGNAGMARILDLPFPEADKVIAMHDQINVGRQLLEDHGKDLKKALEESLVTDMKKLKQWAGGLPDGKNWMANVEDPPLVIRDPSDG